jgi:uncharacterized membrane protein
LADAQHLPQGQCRAGDRHLKFYDCRDNLPPDWAPRFVDYLYVSFTNALAFSPTDTMPLSRWAKTLMAVQSAIAVSTTALVIARAVNVLK